MGNIFLNFLQMRQFSVLLLIVLVSQVMGKAFTKRRLLSHRRLWIPKEAWIINHAKDESGKFKSLKFYCDDVEIVPVEGGITRCPGRGETLTHAHVEGGPEGKTTVLDYGNVYVWDGYHFGGIGTYKPEMDPNYGKRRLWIPKEAWIINHAKDESGKFK